MSFSFSFCLTNTGNIPAGSLINFYSNSNNYDEPPFLSNIPLDDITGTNCPYILTNIPIGTTKILIKDTNSSCCVTIDVLPNNLCDTCDLGFDVYSASTISTIVAGLLTGSCDNNITDYLIYWYNFDDLTQPYATSGYGTEFGPYQHTHPLTGLQSIPVISGEYVAFIQKIKINGINFSIIEEPGFVQANLNCFNNLIFEVESFTCSNGDQTGDYDHLIHYSGASVGVVPPSVQTTFELSTTTNYFAWKFDAFNVPDTFKLIYYGSYYNNEPITLEYYTVGSDLPSTTLWTTPSAVKTTPYGVGLNKVTCLTGLTRSVNDYLVIEITPNQNNNVTNYTLKFTCLDKFDCETCFNNYVNTPYKIYGPSITGTTEGCDIVTILFNVESCSYEDLLLTDTNKYTYIPNVSSPPYSYAGAASWNNTGVGVGTQLFPNINACYKAEANYDVPCYYPIIDSSITFIKDNSGVGGIGNIYMTFNNPTDFNGYYDSYLYQLNLSEPISNNNTNINYYKYLRLQVPDYRGIISPENIGCGDGTPKIDYFIHTSSVVTTGFTNGIYTLNITMPTITSGMTSTNCQLGCAYFMNSVVSYVNSSSTSNLNNQSYVNNRSSRVITPFYRTDSFINYSGSSLVSNQVYYEELSTYYNQTYPMSGSNYTIIPSLSAQTCPLIYGTQNNDFYYGNRQKYQFWYRISLTNPDNNILDFKIEANIIINGAPTETYLLVYEFQNGQVSYFNPNYIIGSYIYLIASTPLAFGGSIPNNYKGSLCSPGINDSPAISWSFRPFLSGGTIATVTSYEILCLDLDTTGYSGPNGEFVHWNVKNIDPTQTSVAMNGGWIGSPTILPTDYPSGDNPVNGWNGPCPPPGQTHNYVIRVSAVLSDNSVVVSNDFPFTSSSNP